MIKGEVERLTQVNSQLDTNVQRLKSELNCAHLKSRRFESDAEGYQMEISNLQNELAELKLGLDKFDHKETQEKQHKIVMAAKISELEKELKPLRFVE